MSESFDYAALDSEAKKYLGDVRRAGGRGAPGLFHTVSDKRPIWASACGIVVLPLFLWIGYTSSKPPWATAMLQTAGILLGGWLIWFALRRWMANTDNYAGYFYYYDSEHAFIGEGETLRVFQIPPGAEVVPQGVGSVLVTTEMDEFRVPVPNRVFGERVADYYHALEWVRSREDGPFVDLESDEAGAVAKYMAEEDEAPPNVTEADLRIDTMTDRVRQKGRAKTGVLGLLVWLAVGGGAYALFFSTNGVLQDNMAFAAARDNIGRESADKFTGAQGLRDYLLNERNTRNRDEAKALLSKLYDAPIAQVQRNPAADPQLRDGMVALLESLRGPDTPAVSIAVTNIDSPTVTNLSKGLRARFADGIATAVGKDLIVFGDHPADKPALLTIHYSRNVDGSMAWTAEIRTKPDDSTVYRANGVTAPVFAQTFQPSPITFGQPTPELPPAETDPSTEAIYNDVMMKLIGQAPGKLVITNEDW